MLSYSCPSCSQSLLAPADRAGLRTVCPKCLHPVTVPDSDGRAPEPFAPPTEATPFTPPPSAAVETPTPVNTEPPLGEDTLELDLIIEVEHPLANSELEPVRLDPAFLQAAVPQRAAATVLSSPATAPPPVVKPATTLEAAVATPTVAHATPQPKAKKFSARDRAGDVVLNPTGLFAVDLAAELSAAISMRMAPPPEPTTDRGAVFVTWAVATVVGIGVWVLGAFHDPAWFSYLLLIGAGMTAAGWLWRAYLSGRRGNLLAAAVTLLPPGCLVQLFRPFGQYGWQPLLFVVTGLGLYGLGWGGPAVHAWVDQRIGVKTISTTANAEGKTPALRLRTATNKAQALTELTSVDKVAAATADERAEISTEIRTCVGSEQAEVRAAALNAYALWAPREALPIAVERLAVKADRDGAKKALVTLGPDAEASVLPLLGSSSEATILTACEVLERIGGEQAQTELRKLADTTGTKAVRVEALDATAAIAKRLTGPK